MSSKAIITQLFVGYFDRAPDPAGLTFWINVFDGGMPLSEIAQFFATSEEAVAIYPALSEVATPTAQQISELIVTIYDNLFDRSPDDAGLQFWTGVLEDGFPVGLFVSAIIDGAVGNDAQILANKVEVACHFVDAAEDDVNYVLDEATIQASRDALSVVTEDPSSIDAGKNINDQFFGGAPKVALINVLASLPEDSDTTDRIKIADIDVTDDDIGTNVLALEGDDATLFEIDGAELFLKAGTLLDFETAPELDITVTVDDANVAETPDDSASFTLSITDANDPPSVSLTQILNDISESADVSIAQRVADIVQSDDSLGSQVLLLSGDDAVSFEIIGDGLFLRAGVSLDFESNPRLDVTVTIDDDSVGSAPDDSADLALSILNANDSPRLELENTVTSLAEDADTSGRVKVAEISIPDDGLGTNALSLSGSDAALFQIDGNDLFLRAGAALDFETQSTLSVTVEVDDANVGSAPDDSNLLNISIVDVNEPPSIALANQVTSLAEDEDVTTRLKMADVVITDDGLGTNTVNLTGADAALFEVDGTELFLRAGTSLDFEGNPNLDVALEIDDINVGASPDGSAVLSVTVADVNEAPTVDLSNTVTVLVESQNTSNRVKVADIVVSDDSLGSNILTLAGTDAALFEIDGTELFLKAGTALDFETKDSLVVFVEIDDVSVGFTPDNTAGLEITILDSNEPPTVALSNMVASVSEDIDTALRTKVADITITDDGAGVNVLSLSGDDAALFEIDGNEVYLQAGTELDFETNPVLDVSVDVDDAGIGSSPDASATLSISVTDINEAPTVTLTNAVTELAEDANTTSRIKMADIVLSDDGLGANFVSLSGADAALFEIDGLELFLRAGVSLDFETAADFVVAVIVDDVSVGSSPDSTAELTVAVTDINETPTVSLQGTTTSILEGTDTSDAIKVADIIVNDDALGTPQLSLSGDDANLFEISGIELFLVAGASLDAVANPDLDVSVEIDDASLAGNPDDTAALSIAVEPGAPGVQGTNVSSLVYVGNDMSELHFGQLIVDDVDANTPGDQPGFVLNTDPNGVPYAGVAGATLALIDTETHLGLVSLGVVAQINGDIFTLDNNDAGAVPNGITELILGEGNVAGVVLGPDLNTDGVWTFDDANNDGNGSGLFLTIEETTTPMFGAGDLILNQLDGITVSGNVDFTSLAVDDGNAANGVEGLQIVGDGNSIGDDTEITLLEGATLSMTDAQFAAYCDQILFTGPGTSLNVDAAFLAGYGSSDLTELRGLTSINIEAGSIVVLTPEQARLATVDGGNPGDLSLITATVRVDDIDDKGVLLDPLRDDSNADITGPFEDLTGIVGLDAIEMVDGDGNANTVDVTVGVSIADADALAGNITKNGNFVLAAAGGDANDIADGDTTDITGFDLAEVDILLLEDEDATLLAVGQLQALSGNNGNVAQQDEDGNANSIDNPLILLASGDVSDENLNLIDGLILENDTTIALHQVSNLGLGVVQDSNQAGHSLFVDDLQFDGNGNFAASVTVDLNNINSDVNANANQNDNVSDGVDSIILLLDTVDNNGNDADLSIDVVTGGVVTGLTADGNGNVNINDVSLFDNDFAAFTASGSADIHQNVTLSLVDYDFIYNGSGSYNNSITEVDGTSSWNGDNASGDIDLNFDFNDGNANLDFTFRGGSGETSVGIVEGTLSSVLATGGAVVVDGGNGSDDILRIESSDDVDANSMAVISNFETLVLSDLNTNETYDLSEAQEFDRLILEDDDADDGADIDVTGISAQMAQDIVFRMDGDGDFLNDITLALDDASGSTDEVQVTFEWNRANTTTNADYAVGDLTIDGVEEISFVSTGDATDSNDNPTINDVSNLVADDVEIIDLSGDVDFNINIASDATNLEALDANDLDAALSVNFADIDASFAFLGAAMTNTVDLTASVADFDASFDTGSGNDNVQITVTTANPGDDIDISVGAGNDTVTADGDADSTFDILLGEGDDAVFFGTDIGADAGDTTIRGEDGNDLIIVLRATGDLDISGGDDNDLIILQSDGPSEIDVSVGSGIDVIGFDSNADVFGGTSELVAVADFDLAEDSFLLLADGNANNSPTSDLLFDSLDTTYDTTEDVQFTSTGLPSTNYALGGAVNGTEETLVFEFSFTADNNGISLGATSTGADLLSGINIGAGAATITADANTQGYLLAYNSGGDGYIFAFEATGTNVTAGNIHLIAEVDSIGIGDFTADHFDMMIV